MEQEIKIIPEVEEQIMTIEKEQGIIPQGTINITSNGETDVSEYATANVNVDFALQSKEVSITENGTTTIIADDDYNGLSQVQVNVNVPPAKYAPQYVMFGRFNGTDLTNETRQLDTSNITIFTQMFYYCQGLKSLDCSGFNTSNVTKMNEMFYYSFRYTGGVGIDLDLSNFTSEKLTDIQMMFYGCTYLKSIDLSGLTSGIQNVSYAFSDCKNLEILDLSNMDFSTIQWNNYTFNNCGTSTTSGLTTVYVKDATAQNWVLTANNGHPETWSTANVIIKS